jgi:hypothetical protein
MGGKKRKVDKQIRNEDTFNFFPQYGNGCWLFLTNGNKNQHVPSEETFV